MPFSLALLPKGHQLVVRGIVPVLNETPAAAVKDLLLNLESEPRYSGFADFGLNVLPFSDRASNLSSACYVEVLSGGEAEPRVDLLEIVMEAIVEAKPEWEVRWSACKKGRSDRRLSCRLLDLYPGVTDRTAIPPDHLPLIKAHVEKKGFKIGSIFASFGGPQITFLLPSDADRFNALQFIEVPAKVSTGRARIEPLKEIPILRPFELVVSGARDFDHLEGILEKWIKKTVPHSLIDIRTTPLNSDLIIFTMSTWTDTAKILRSADSFQRHFRNQLSTPRLLWDYNDDPLNKNSLGDQVAKGASMISGNVASLSRQIQELRGEVTVIRRQQEDLATNQTKMCQAISDLDTRVGQTQQALLIQGQECLLRSQIGDDESRISSLRVAAMFSNGKPKEDFERAIADFEASAADKRERLSKFTNQLAAVTGHPLLPTPPPSTLTSHSPPSVPTPQPASASPLPLAAPARAPAPPAGASLRISIPSSSSVSMSTPGKAKKRKVSVPLDPSTSRVTRSALSPPASTLPDLDPVPRGNLMDQDGDTVSTNSSRSLLSSTVYVGVRRISDEPNEVGSTLTCVASLREDRDARLAQRRKLSLHGAIRRPVYAVPSFPAFSSFRFLGPIHMPPSCYGESVVPPPVLSSAYSSDLLVNCAPVSRVVSSSNFLLLTKPPYPLSRTLNFRFRIRVLITLLVLLLFVNTTMAMPTFAQSELTVCALNANGLMSPVKLALIGPLLMKLAPHFFALSETKTRTNAVSNLQISNYEVFEEKAVPCAAPSTLAKWGIILGVRKDIQIVARIPLNLEPLEGRVVCVDVVVPSLSSFSTSFIHRVFAVYAPCDPGADDLSLNFWPCLTDVL